MRWRRISLPTVRPNSLSKSFANVARDARQPWLVGGGYEYEYMATIHAGRYITLIVRPSNRSKTIMQVYETILQVTVWNIPSF